MHASACLRQRDGARKTKTSGFTHSGWRTLGTFAGAFTPKPKRSRRTAAQVKAEKALERVYRMQETTAAAIAALPALTAVGIRAKLEVVTANPDYTDGRDQFGTKCPPLIAIGASLMRDLRRIDPAARLSPPMTA